jgi:hypothetical protein
LLLLLTLEMIMVCYLGVFYMAMPLTAAATNYYTVHLEFKEKAKMTSSSAVTPIDASQPPRVRESVRISAINLLEILKDMNTFADGLQKPSIYPMGIDGEQLAGQEADDEGDDDDKDSSASEDSTEEEKKGDNNPAARVKRASLHDPRMPRNASIVLKHAHSLFMALDELLNACKVDLRVMLELQLQLKSRKQ